MEVEFKKERNDRQAVFLQVFHEKIMDFREYPYQISLNAKIERKAKKRKEAKQIKKANHLHSAHTSGQMRGLLPVQPK